MKYADSVGILRLGPRCIDNYGLLLPATDGETLEDIVVGLADSSPGIARAAVSIIL